MGALAWSLGVQLTNPVLPVNFKKWYKYKPKTLPSWLNAPGILGLSLYSDLSFMAIKIIAV